MEKTAKHVRNPQLLFNETKITTIYKLL